MYYSAIGVLAFMVLVIENQDIFLNRSSAFEKPAWKVYRRFLFSVLAYYITDIFWGLLESRKLSRLLFADTSAYFLAMAAGIWFWTLYTVTYLEVKGFFKHFLLYAGHILSTAVAVLVIANIFTPLLFTVDDACVYTALPVRYVVLGAQILLLLSISVYAIVSFIRHRTEHRLRYRTLALFGLSMAVFLFEQLWFPYLPLYAIAYMLGTCLLRAFVIGDEKEAYRHDLEEATRIAEVKQSIHFLMDNMPALSFSKDAQTGVYLACNQAFADYAQKKSPADVVGLTDYDLFDEVTAAHFVGVDRTALQMDEPYILFEDVTDSAGNPRQFQTTKLRFYDSSHKLCLLGMSVDVTETERLRREGIQTKAAYQQALSASAVYENMMNALSADYFDLYYVDLETDAYIEYHTGRGVGSRVAETHGTDFFSASKKDALKYIYKEDQTRVIGALDKEKMIAEIRTHGTFILQYRLMIRDVPTYVSMKATCTSDDESHMIIGVNNIDAQVRDRIAAQQALEDKKAYLRLSALTGNLIVVYVVDPEDGQYTEYNATKEFEWLGIDKQGKDFFGTSHKNSLRTVHPEDLELFRSLVTKENVLNAIRRDGVFVLDYRLLMGGTPMYVRFKAAQVDEDGKPRLIVGLMNIDAQVRQEQAYANDLSAARSKATRDALTGVKNKYAYADTEKQLNSRIADRKPTAFAVVICDINDLKIVNDTKGHTEGDQYIQRASAVICNVFKHSPVFRIGGDEFAVICQGHDYEHIEALLEEMSAANARGRETGDLQIAFGMARYAESDRTVAAVFDRADHSMYAYKAQIKAQKTD